jgi:tight adherence protein C
MFLSIAVLLFVSITQLLEEYKRKKLINSIFHIDETFILNKNETNFKEELKTKLAKAGLEKKEFNEIIAASILAGLSLIFLIFLSDFSRLTNIFIAFAGVAVALFMPFIYLEEQIKARIKRIDNDLAIFIDLLIIILEGGGGLNNAIDKVTIEGESVLGKDLLEESRRFKNEFITYSSDIAYDNLAKRTGSEAIATIVGFMRLSEETGIGVKTIFENQAGEIKSAEMLSIEKKAATMNIGITFVMFLFILPAVIAMIAFPMSADALMPGFK